MGWAGIRYGIWYGIWYRIYHRIWYGIDEEFRLIQVTTQNKRIPKNQDVTSKYNGEILLPKTSNEPMLMSNMLYDGDRLIYIF